MPDRPFVLQLGDFKTLPIYSAKGTLQETLHAFDKAQVKVEYVEPEYSFPPYCLHTGWIEKVSTDASLAMTVCAQWRSHISEYLYYVQFKIDSTRQLISALSSHTDLVSALCDARLGIDTSELWKTFDGVYAFEIVQREYHEDEDRNAKWDEYAGRLDEVYARLSEHLVPSTRLIKRIVKQVQLKASGWKELPPILLKDNGPKASSRIQLFYSYSHRDEDLRDELEKHLSLLKRQEIIEGWHDRQIAGGREWEGQIDKHLESARVILLLVSADFLASDYCYDREMRRAMERHHEGKARVIPIILRACDWSGSPFGSLQALPKDAKPVTSWSNMDEAFTDVAKGIRKAVETDR